MNRFRSACLFLALSIAPRVAFSDDGGFCGIQQVEQTTCGVNIYFFTRQEFTVHPAGRQHRVVTVDPAAVQILDCGWLDESLCSQGPCRIDNPVRALPAGLHEVFTFPNPTGGTCSIKVISENGQIGVFATVWASPQPGEHHAPMKASESRFLEAVR